MSWLQRIVWIGASMMLVGCTGTSGKNCPPGSEKRGSACLESDTGVQLTDADDDSGGRDTGDNYEQEKNPDPVQASCTKETDEDGDGHLCNYDNCPTKANADQKDRDGDGVGNPCDNCPEIANAGQDAAVCQEDNAYNVDRDQDGDGTRDVDDNCPETPNGDQADDDNDKRGNKCDNCNNVANYHQTDSDGDGTGDACSKRPVGETCGKKTKTAEPKTPDIYVVLDKSGSMVKDQNGNPTGRWSDATDALDQIADKLGNSLNFGLMGYSAPGYACGPRFGRECHSDCVIVDGNGNGVCVKRCELPEWLPMGSHTPSQIKQSYAGKMPKGNTPSPAALRKVRKQQLYRLPGSNNDAVVVYLTDGQPNTDGPVSRPNDCKPDRQAPNATVTEARKLHDNGVKVYAIGFQGGKPAQLNRVAKAGGTDAGAAGKPYFIEANNTQQLVNGITGIALQCKYDVDPPSEGVAPSKIWVKANGTYLDRSEYSYNKSDQSVSLTKAACQKIKSQGQNADQVKVEIVLGCPNKCGSSEEVCDYQDNDCDGDIDEGCDGCTGEVCDGEDNDCDGDIDEGCPNCSFKGASCSADGDCCNGNCTADGVCGPPCRSTGAVCTENSQCCTGNCAIPGSAESGKCQGK